MRASAMSGSNNSRRTTGGYQAGPRVRITANIFIFGPDAHLRLYSGVTALFSRAELRTW